MKEDLTHQEKSDKHERIIGNTVYKACVSGKVINLFHVTVKMQ